MLLVRLAGVKEMVDVLLGVGRVRKGDKTGQK